MPDGLQTKYGKKIFAIIGCFAAWLLYTLIFRQIIRYDNNNIPAKNSDLKQETYEIDQRVSVCFKDVAPFSMLLKQDENICRNIHDLLIVVHMDPSSFQLRAEFRKTLRKIKKEATVHNLQINSFFMLGLDKDQCISFTLLQEMSLERDILISSIVESNENQTLKSVNTLKWFHENCSNSKLLLKLDAKMNPSTSFSMKQFYKLIKSWRIQDIVLLGSLNMPKPTSKSDSVSHSRLTTSSLNPVSAQYLHLNYLLSRNVVISLLKARADAINISAWKEDLFVTGVLANVAQIRPKHDERFLRQCAGSFCIFCECFVDLERQIDFSRPNYFAQSLTRSEEPTQPSKRFIFKTDSTWSINQYEPTTDTDHTLPTTTNGAETSFTEIFTFTSTTPGVSEATTTLGNKFSTQLSESAGVETTSTTFRSTPTTTNNIPDSSLFSREDLDTSSEISSQYSEMSYTTTELPFQGLESENFIVTASTQGEYVPVHSSLTTSVLELWENKITHSNELTTDSENFYSSLSGDSYATETDVTKNSEINLGTTPTEANDLFQFTTDPNFFSPDSNTISTLYPTIDVAKSAGTRYDPDVTSPSISDKFADAINVFRKNSEEYTFVNKFQNLDDQQELFSTNTVGSTILRIDATTPTYLCTTEDGPRPINFQRDLFTEGSWSDNEQQDLERTTALHATEFRTETVYDSSSVCTDATSEDSFRATTIELDADGVSTLIEEKESASKSTPNNFNNSTCTGSLTTNCQTDPPTIQEPSEVSNGAILKRTTRVNIKSETTEYFVSSTYNPISTPKETEYSTISTQPKNLETISTTTDNGQVRVTTNLVEDLILEESLENSDIKNEIRGTTEIFFYRSNYSSQRPTLELRNSSGFVDNEPKTFPANSSVILQHINMSLNSNLASSYISTQSPVGLPHTITASLFSRTNETSSGEEKQLAEDVANKSSSKLIEKNLNEYFSSQTMSSETADSSTKKYTFTSEIDREVSLDSEGNGVNKVNEISVTKPFEISFTKTDPNKVDFIRKTIPKRKFRVRISSSTSKSESLELKSAPGVRVTSSTSTESKGQRKLEFRKLRRKRKKKKIVIRIHKMFMKLSTAKTSGVLKNSSYFPTFQKRYR